MNPTKFNNSDYTEDIKKNIKDVSFDHLTRILYSTDASIYQIMPVGVIYPRYEDEIKIAIEISRFHHIPVLARGSGTSLAGQAIGEALIIDFKRHFKEINEINIEEKFIIAQSGAILGEINRKVAKHGMIFGPDPASANMTTVGGIIGNNSTGAHFIEYGMTADNIFELELILDDGQKINIGKNSKNLLQVTGREKEIYWKVSQVAEKNKDEINKRFPSIKRNVSGYALNLLGEQELPDILKLITGSEGTLGIVPKAKLELVERPKHKWMVIIQYSDILEALKSVPEILESNCSAVELMDKILINLSKENNEYKRIGGFIEGYPDALLLIELSGHSRVELESKFNYLKGTNPRSELKLIKDITLQDKIWKIRSSGLGILMSVPGDAKPIPFIEDVAVPVEKLADYAIDIKSTCKEHGIDEVAFYAHASSGCLHVRPNIDLKSKTGKLQMREIANAAFEIVSKYNGANSGEHGDGLVRSEFLKKMYGSEIVDAFREIKNIFDPDNIMNPGKIVDSPKMDDSNLFRYRDDYDPSTDGFEIIQDFKPHAGMIEAVEMCSGSGECLQLSGGVMCPSFQVTEEEINSTRGRANVLRAFLSGYYQNNELDPDQVFDVMDLCLSCQACKVECPSSVDMAKIKAEFLHSYYLTHKPSLRTTIFANIDRLSIIAQKVSNISNWVISNFSGYLNKALKIDQHRTLPKYSNKKFSRWYKEKNIDSKQTEKQVVFFTDTFTEFHKAEAGKKAIQVLEHLGYSPILVKKQVCCGRSAYSKGFLDRAKKLAVKNIQVLLTYAKKGIPIVGVEPSCLAMFVNEYLSLVPGEDTNLVASHVKMIEEFLFDEITSNQLQIKFDGKSRNVIYHGHCQQKANFGTEKTIEFLKLIPNISLKLADSGCCGMAGSFGYEEEHFEISTKIGEKSLVQLIDFSGENQIISASGTSCRDQIDFLTDKSSIHPIEIFADALDLKAK